MAKIKNHENIMLLYAMGGLLQTQGYSYRIENKGTEINGRKVVKVGGRELEYLVSYSHTHRVADVAVYEGDALLCLCSCPGRKVETLRRAIARMMGRMW